MALICPLRHSWRALVAFMTVSWINRPLATKTTPQRPTMAAAGI